MKDKKVTISLWHNNDLTQSFYILPTIHYYRGFCFTAKGVDVLHTFEFSFLNIAFSIGVQEPI